jgi:hypothetical protein
MKSLIRKPLPKPSPITELAKQEMDQWIEERNRRFAERPLRKSILS